MISDPRSGADSGGAQDGAAAPIAPASYRVGDLIVDLGQARVARGEQVLSLPRLSFDLLVALIRAAPNLVSQDQLMSRVWPGLVVGPETVGQRVKLLRDALEDDPKEPRYVAAVRGRGYRLVAPVSLEPAGRAPTPTPASTSASAPAPPPAPPSRSEVAPAPSPASSESVPADTAAPRQVSDALLPAAPSIEPTAQPTYAYRWILLSACIAIAVAVVGIFVWRGTESKTSAQPHTSDHVEVANVSVQSIAVLPFENVSGEPSSRVLATGIAESVLHQLASHHQLIVISRSSSFAFEGRNIDAREIGRQLNARYLLEGSLQRQDARLRVTADLIDSSTGARVWSMRFDKTPTDIFAMQDDIAIAVERALERSVTVTAGPRPSGAQTQNLDAWLAYQQGRALAATRKLADLDLAQKRFAEATRLDPEFALAYVARAETLAVRSMFSRSDTWLGVRPELSTDAEKTEVAQWLARAMALNPREGTAYTVRAWLNDNAREAAEDYRRGLALSPNDAIGYERFAKLLYSFRTPDDIFIDPARRDEAFGAIDRALELDPLSPSPHITKALMMLYGRANASEAQGLLLRALELQPNYYPALIRLAETRYFQGETADAIRYAEQALALEPQATWARHYLLRIYLNLGDVAAARDLVRGGLAEDTLLRLPISLYQHDWKTADELAKDDAPFGTPLDDRFVVCAWIQHVRVTRDFEPLRKKLEEWSGVKWNSSGEPTVMETNLDYSDSVALAEVLMWMGQRDRADRLLHAILRMLDHGSRDLKRGDDMYGVTRSAVFALLGDREGALNSLQKMPYEISGGAMWVGLELNPAFDDLRGDLRYRHLQARVEEKAAAQRKRLEEMRTQGAVPRRNGLSETSNRH